MENKLKTAITFLKEGQSFTVGDLRMDSTHQEQIGVTGWSNYHNRKNLNKQACLNELREIKKLFHDMLLSSEEFRKFIKEKEIIYNLEFDDYGKASIGVCSEKNDHVQWHINL